MSTVDPTFLEQLLYRGESETLDFKRDQFPFANAAHNAKSKLLKDVLAFANSWRQETAYILTGVDDAPGAKSNVVGVASHLDDADLQQFVNSKTQKPVAFSYQAAVLEGKDVGVIAIPVQTRPIYARRKYGIVEKETVYLRRGSSNAIATPEEVARMGAAHTATPSQLRLSWADLETGTTVPSPLAVSTVHFSPVLPPDAFESPRTAGHAWSLPITRNPDYSRELVEFLFWRALLIDVGLCLQNAGSVVAKRVRLVASIERNEETVVRDDQPRPPSRHSYLHRFDSVQNALLHRDDPDPCVQTFKDRWEVTVEFGDVRPHDEVWTTSPLLLGSVSDQRLALVGELRGDNIATPAPCKLEVDFSVESREMRKTDARHHLRAE